MKTHVQQFNAKKFSFHDDPVLVLENFWSEQETAMFREAMARAAWKSLADMPAVAQAFQNCGNWVKAEMGQTERETFLNKLSLPCIANYVESFPNRSEEHTSELQSH